MNFGRILVLLIACTAIAGCSATPSREADAEQPAVAQQQEATVPVAPQVEPTPTPVVSNEGLPIQVLTSKSGSASDTDRAALLAAAHKSSGITDSQYYVWQLLKQGSTAVGDFQGTSSAKRTLVVFEKRDGVWTVVSKVKYLDATESGVKDASAAISSKLAADIDYVVPVSVDEYYKANASAVRKLPTGGKMYAPTRLPEGFKKASSTNLDQGSSSVEYRNGAARFTVFAWISGEYGDDPGPKATSTGLRYGDMAATMDPSFNYRTDSSAKGPFLTAAGGNQAVSGLGVSPGMMAAVAESMVQVR